MVILGLILSFALCTVYYYIETVRHGMAKKRWVMAALCLGPMTLPMFEISKHLAVRKASGFNNVYIRV